VPLPVRRLRVACVGTGFIAGRHLDALSRHDDVDIVAVADTVKERADAAALAYGARAYTDARQVFEREELDAVWICVPPFAHGPLERAAIDRGLPFFVEKPLAHDLETAVDIATRLEDSGLLAAVGYHWRYLSVVEQAAAMLARNPPFLVSGSWLDVTPAVPWWVERRRSGGQVLEQTTHLFDLTRCLVGEVEEVTADEVVMGLGPGTTPLASTASLRFASGAVGSMSSARSLPNRLRVALELVGDGYVVELSEQSLTDHRLRIETSSGERVDRVNEDPIAREDRAFLDAVAGIGSDIRAPYADALRSHALAWAADVSARHRTPVRLGTLAPLP
jgi:myo-inositol 2-dehydrogenase/D-chiro-inositol 1-dehydrogenase